ncbi:MAG: ferritin-like domain-containing protein [Thermoleophilia bacterium]|nr:ferritin-like domain-containing protein [Thermoleophilia bacterium]MDH3725759.1 ferritin-like domain-containing protein [Thermoleophilia bacterium]
MDQTTSDAAIVAGGMTGTELLQHVDRDGAVQQTMAAAVSRSGFLKTALFGAGALFAALNVPGAIAASNDSPNDTAILNYLLTLERVQAAFFGEAERVAAISGRELQAAKIIGAVERAHVAALLERLGAKAIASPSFDFLGTTEDPEAFIKTAVAFEDLGSVSIAGVLPDIQAPAIRTIVASVHTPEARHAGWIRTLAGVDPAPNAIEGVNTQAETLKLVNGTGFIVSEPLTTATLSPSFTG